MERVAVLLPLLFCSWQVFLREKKKQKQNEALDSKMRKTKTQNNLRLTTGLVALAVMSCFELFFGGVKVILSHSVGMTGLCLAKPNPVRGEIRTRRARTRLENIPCLCEIS